MIFGFSMRIAYDGPESTATTLCLQIRCQLCQILDILVHVLAFWGLQNLRYRSPARVLHDPLEAIESDLSLAEMFVPIDPRSQRHFGIVQMEAEHASRPK